MLEFANPCTFAHYAVVFIDILGQRAACGKENLIPVDDQSRKEFESRARGTIGPIVQLQTLSQGFLDGARERSTSIRDTLSAHLRPRFDDLRRDNLKVQYWSDGVVWFQSLKESEVKVPLIGVFLLLGVAGTQCLFGLSSKCPVRGGLEIAWATELRPGELYGCAITRAYEFESEIAQYPRMVVGPYFCKYLEDVSMQKPTDDISNLNKSMADQCLEMITLDVDGYAIVDYLGAGFQKYITKGEQSKLKEKALDFIRESLNEWKSKRNTKLVLRYQQLLSYFEGRNN